jgi:hypothetical protein
VAGSRRQRGRRLRLENSGRVSPQQNVTTTRVGNIVSAFIGCWVLASGQRTSRLRVRSTNGGVGKVIDRGPVAAPEGCYLQEELASFRSASASAIL